MKLSSIWKDFTPAVQRVFTGLARDSDRVRTKSLLGALSDLSESDGAEVLCDIESKADVELIHPAHIPDEPGECPEELTFSPCVKETLNFFRIHQLRPIGPADLALRVIQIGTGSTVRALERSGHLGSIRERLAEFTNH